MEEVIDSARVSDEIFGFHCQQAVEKLLKALLAVAGVRVGRTHDLGHLMDLLADAGHSLPAEAMDLDRLTPFGTTLRYEDPADDTHVERRETIAAVGILRLYVETVIAGLPRT